MKEFLRKISSRKLWIAVIGIGVGLATAFGIDESEYSVIAGMITSAIATLGYIVSEAKVDAAHKDE